MTDHRKGIRYRYLPAVHPFRLLCTILLTFFLLAGVIALIVYLVYRPSKPHFSVAGATVFQLSNSSTQPNVLSTGMQFTLVSRNPSERSSILYDHLSAYVSYRNQPITPPANLPPLFQDRDSSIAMSPVLGGDFVPVSGDVASGLLTDQAYGVVNLRVVLTGRLRYKSGPFWSGWYNLYVRCDMLVGVRKGVTGAVPLLGEPQCDVDT
ncbi:NDR1/HIN1-like protein 1 [Phoenix dactylifera]|uniref:NDR1/HIN1-like protein 1 n=1 Tax=Phoenix dactylifera TaxID=42345 RepID=A0A8B7D024_PHODC|nr:NDR1/HIN1-like protein 1 [Phoenix dactylifera]